jgi:hypothetical protein
MSTVTYSIYAENYGDAVIGLTPKCISLIDLETGVDQPLDMIEVVEIKDGFYKFNFEWNEESSSAYLCKIDLDISDTIFGDNRQRYIIMRLEKQDDTYNVVSDIKSSAATISASSEQLSKLVARLLEVESGEWKIEEDPATGLWKLNIYATGKYESATAEDTIIASYVLRNVNDISTYISPIRRLKDTILDLP